MGAIGCLRWVGEARGSGGVRARPEVREGVRTSSPFTVALQWCQQDSFTTRLWATESNPITAADAACFPTPDKGGGGTRARHRKGAPSVRCCSKGKTITDGKSHLQRGYFLFLKACVMRAQPGQEALAFPQSLPAVRARRQTPRQGPWLPRWPRPGR